MVHFSATRWWFRISNGGVGSVDSRASKVASLCARGKSVWGTTRSERMDMSEESGSQGSPLKSEMGITTVSNAVISQIAGIAAQEVEKVQMGGGATAAVGGFLQSVTGGVTGGSTSGGGNFSRGVSVEVGEEEAAIDLTMAIEYGQSIPRITDAVRRNVINRVESLSGLRVTEVNIQVNDVQVPEERPMLAEQEQTEEMARRQEQQA
jgi:uncharacterized alkaline shock family protein YloU